MQYPKHAAWESGMAYTYLQMAEAIRLSPNASQSEIRADLTQARDILLRQKQRFVLAAVDQSRLNTVEDALRRSERN